MTELHTMSDAALESLNLRLRDRYLTAAARGDLEASTGAITLRQSVVIEQLRRKGWPVPARHEEVSK